MHLGTPEVLQWEGQKVGKGGLDSNKTEGQGNSNKHRKTKGQGNKEAGPVSAELLFSCPALDKHGKQAPHEQQAGLAGEQDGGTGI